MPDVRNLLHPGKRMRAYPCGDFWHIGNVRFATRAEAELHARATSNTADLAEKAGIPTRRWTA